MGTWVLGCRGKNNNKLNPCVRKNSNKCKPPNCRAGALVVDHPCYFWTIPAADHFSEKSETSKQNGKGIPISVGKGGIPGAHPPLSHRAHQKFTNLTIGKNGTPRASVVVGRGGRFATGGSHFCDTSKNAYQLSMENRSFNNKKATNNHTLPAHFSPQKKSFFSPTEKRRPACDPPPPATLTP